MYTGLQFAQQNVSNSFTFEKVLKINFQNELIVSGLKNAQRGGFGIPTDRGQQSMFWVSNFKNLYFFGY